MDQIMIACILLVMLLILLLVNYGATLPEAIFDKDNDKFIVIERIDDYHYIIADKKTRYEYFISHTHTGYWVIGGNVLDETGTPKKYEESLLK